VERKVDALSERKDTFSYVTEYDRPRLDTDTNWLFCLSSMWEGRHRICDKNATASTVVRLRICGKRALRFGSS